jgi:prolyl-tRNA editing enzyme YbaK/EbsC (Cys-tRNA(Pro) deacylase)
VTVSVLLEPAVGRPDLLAEPTARALDDHRAVLPLALIRVAPIDPDLADTAAFCAAYGVSPAQSANCVVVAAKRAGETTYAACLVLATTRADVNGLARRHLGARKISFAPMDDAVDRTGMQYGGITPIGLPADWPILIDPAVTAAPEVVIGSGIRGSKLWLPGAALALLPGAVVLPGLGVPPASPPPEPAQ